MGTITNEIRDQLFDFALLAPTTQKAIGMAQHEAIKMNAPEVYLVHVFLAAVRQDDVEVNEVLKDIGLDPHMIQTQSAETFGNPNNEDIRKDLLFSRELLICFEWAISFATEMNSEILNQCGLFCCP